MSKRKAKRAREQRAEQFPPRLEAERRAKGAKPGSVKLNCTAPRELCGGCCASVPWPCGGDHRCKSAWNV